MVITNIQCLRAVAALMVVWLHAKDQIPGMNQYFQSGFGAAGVDLFFVISGLIMVYSTTNKKITPVDFFVKRIQRIAPLYWLATTVLVLVALVAPQLQRSTTLVWPHVLASYLFIPAQSPSFPDQMWPVLIPGWTLNYEMAFYAVFALTLFFKQSLRLLALSLTIGIAVACGLIFELGGVLGFYTNDVMLTFVLGALVGKLIVAKNFKPDFAKGLICFLITLGLWFALGAADIQSRFVNVGIPAAFMVLAFAFFPSMKSSKTHLLVVLGDASYSIYLTHIFTLAVIRLVVNRSGLQAETVPEYWLFMLVCLLSCSAVGYLSHRLVEQPIARFIQR